LPSWVQVIARGIPATYVFEGMRQVLRGEGFPTHHLVCAFGLNVLYLIGAGMFFNYMFGVAREKGLLAKLGTQ
jgi:ABC-2 type transport system permease protein